VAGRGAERGGRPAHELVSTRTLNHASRNAMFPPCARAMGVATNLNDALIPGLQSDTTQVTPLALLVRQQP
jgi:hypothetical protein